MHSNSSRSMDSGLPILNCLLQHTLRNLCNSHSSSTTTSSSSSSKWVYSIFWRILPRNYPPPKWEHGGSVLDRVKGNKRNWILVWEDGFCDFFACQGNGGGFGAHLFFKMSHELYNYGEGLVGKVAADNSHKWVFQNSPNESDPNRNAASIHHQPKAWEAHFNSGIQTIAIISVREGIVQLGSFDKVDEDFNLVISIQRKFTYLQSIPGIYAVQRPSLLPMQIQYQYPLTFKPNQIIEAATEDTAFGGDEKRQLVGSKRLYCDRPPDDFTANNPTHNGSSSGPSASVWSIPPLFPWTPGPTYPGTKPSKLLAISPSCNQIDNTAATAAAAASFNTRVGENAVFSAHANECDIIINRNLKVNESCKLEAAHEDKGGSIGHNIVEMGSKVVEMGFASQSKAEGAFDLN